MRDSAPASLRSEHNAVTDRTLGVMQEARKRARGDPDSVPLDRFMAEDDALRGRQTDRWSDIAAERWGTAVGLAEVGHDGCEIVAHGFGIGPRADVQRAIGAFFESGDRDALNATVARMMPAEGDARRQLMEKAPYSGSAADRAEISRTLTNAVETLGTMGADHEEAGAAALGTVARALPDRNEPNRFADVNEQGLFIFETAQSATLLRLTYRIRGIA